MPHHSYIFFDVRESIHDVPLSTCTEYKKDFVAYLTKTKGIHVYTYATLGLKPNTRFMFHIHATTVDEVQIFLRDLLKTDLGRYLTITHTLMGMTRSSQYNPHHAPQESIPETPHRYLVVYPFTKTIEWHLLPYEERRNIMKAHVEVGKKFSSDISQLLLYSFGIDDHEFIVSYQMDSLEPFQTLVMELRGTEARRYTQNDVPIFTCIRMSETETIEMI